MEPALCIALATYITHGIPIWSFSTQAPRFEVEYYLLTTAYACPRGVNEASLRGGRRSGLQSFIATSACIG
jgi:hypothetical protein